jgi:hypothetical protein
LGCVMFDLGEVRYTALLHFSKRIKNCVNRVVPTLLRGNEDVG